MKLEIVTAAENFADPSLSDEACASVLERLLEKRTHKNGKRPRLVEQRNEHAALRRAITVLRRS